MECEHLTKFYPASRPGRSDYINCELVDAVAGHRCGVRAARCERCKHEEGDDSLIQAVATKHLKTRLLSGDSARYPPMNLGAAFAKYRDLVGDAEARGLLAMMFERQARISEADGGHPPDVLAAKFELLAIEHGMEDVLVEIAEKHEKAAEIISGS